MALYLSLPRASAASARTGLMNGLRQINRPGAVARFHLSNPSLHVEDSFQLRESQSGLGKS